MSDITDDSSEYESKSGRKRQMRALQDIGEALVALPDAQLSKIELPEKLHTAVIHARTLKTGEAKRRQMQYIGKIMRNVEVGPIEAALEKIQSKGQQNKAQFHLIERWRDRLIEEGDTALESFITKYTTADRQHIRQLIRKAQHEKKIEKNAGAERELFRYLRTLIEA